MPKLKAPEGATACSFAGETFEVVDGAVDVPDEAVAELMNHGFVTPELDAVTAAALVAAADAAAVAKLEAASDLKKGGKK